LGELWARRTLLRDKPVLIVWGMKDIAFREKELNTWSRAFPEARVIRLDDVGHYVQEEAVDELGQALRSFLSWGNEVPSR
jgi:haloalkane dehalogenase